ncbi:hypothetical protein [Thermococcus sp. 21S7]|uniref:hypothetical protein n=1 Tax=Thermococcus sp. 21S7 TaxID=1638221 RepID=UPI001438BD7F|nr:hypothetical protein [Thermococcus sp. 21S7]NJE61522.1 hypothetical protein [Thermococcus sp. 21S7]
MKADRERAKKLIKEAYEFGYFIGYKGHSDWAEWVRNMKEELYTEAEGLEIYDLVREAYARGKAEGAKKREEEIHLSLIEKGRVTEKAPRPKVKPRAEEKEVPEEELRRVEFARFLETTRILLPPDILDSMRHLDFPKMLRPRD